MCKRAPGRRCKDHVAKAYDRAVSDYLQAKDSPDDEKRIEAEINLAIARVNFAGAKVTDKKGDIEVDFSPDVLKAAQRFNRTRDIKSSILNDVENDAYLAGIHLNPIFSSQLASERRLLDKALTAQNALLTDTPLSDEAYERLEEEYVTNTVRANQVSSQIRMDIAQAGNARQALPVQEEVIQSATPEDKDLRGVRWGHNPATPDIRVGYNPHEARVFVNDNGYVYSVSVNNPEEARKTLNALRSTKGLKALPTAAAIHDLDQQTKIIDSSNLHGGLTPTLNTLSTQRDLAIERGDYRAVAAINDSIRSSVTRMKNTHSALRYADLENPRTDIDNLPSGLRDSYHAVSRMNTMLDQRIVGREAVVNSTGAFVPGQKTVVTLEGNRNISGTIYRDRGEIGVEEASGKRTPFYSHAYNNLTPHVLKSVRIVS